MGSTDQKRQPVQLDMAAFVNSVVDYAIIGLDANGNISTWNAGAERLKGYSAAEIIGRHFSNFYGPEDREAGLPQSLLQLAKDKGHIEHTGWRVRKDGTRFWGDVVISAVRDTDGSVIGFTKVTRDLTERMLAEERERELTLDLEFANRMKSEFLANMSHEVRTPLNGIIGMLTLLADTELDFQQSDLVRTAHDSSNALLRIVNDILDFSKVEAGRMELEREPFSVEEVLSQVRDLFEPQARAKALRLRVMKDDELPKFVIGDAGRLRQVLTNLVGNGVKFTTEGSVSLSASLESADAGTATVCFEVVDTGPGIPPEDRKRLFEAFSQADASTTRRFGGTGLGLPISQRLVGLMGGEIELKSNADTGSVFSFSLRLAVAVPEDATGLPSTTDAVEANGNNRRVLIAEDNEVNQQVAKLLVERLGYNATVVGNGREAVEAIQKEHFDVVLMDCQMPVLDGFAATEQIRGLEGPLAEIPVVAVTASAMPQERRRCFAAGMDDFLPKPIFLNDLSATLQRALHDGPRQPNAAVVSSAAGIDVSQLADVYEKSAAKLLNTLDLNLRERDVEGAAMTVHTLKGSSTSVGAKEMTDVALSIEHALRDKSLNLATALCKEARSTLPRAVEFIRNSAK